MKNAVTPALQIWMIKNSAEIPNRIKSFNRMNNSKAPINTITLETYDVKTLYTNLPHDDLLQKIWELFGHISQLDKHHELMIAINGKDSKLIYGNQVDYGNSRWKHYYTLRDVMSMLEFLIRNTYVTVTDKCFQQVIGIPMGTNAGVNIVDYYLTSYELAFCYSLNGYINGLYYVNSVVPCAILTTSYLLITTYFINYSIMT